MACAVSGAELSYSQILTVTRLNAMGFTIATQLPSNVTKTWAVRSADRATGGGFFSQRKATPARFETSFPRVQRIVLIGQRNSSRQQIGKRFDNVSRLRIAPGIVVAPYDQDAWMMSARISNQVVQRLEIGVVPRHAGSAFVDAISKMIRITAAGQSGLGGQADIVAHLA
jgi:hypothetical protein